MRDLHTPVEIESARIHVETWASGRVRTGTQMEARGRLEKVDLRSHEFRVRDDVGNAVILKHVADADDAAQHVGQWVLATGSAVLVSGRLDALEDACVSPFDDPARPFLRAVATDVDELLASAPGPDPDGGLDLTDGEYAAFIKAARG